MLRGVWGDPERYRDTYWSRFPGKYFAGDGAKRDDDGDYWLLGRVDDVMLVSGHNISTAEVEHALVGHPAVAEAAVVGTKDATTGQAISAFVILRAGNEPSDALVADLRDHVGQHHRPDRQARRRSCSPRTSPRRARARSCAGSCATSPKTRRSATPPRSPTRRWSRGSRLATSPPPPTRTEAVEQQWRSHGGPDTSPSTGPGTTGRSSPAPRSSSTSTACSPTPSSRQHYLEAPRRDWNAFFEACGDDPVIEEMKVLLDLLDPDLRIVLLTARPERVHHLTEAWLRRYRIRWDVLLMRPWGDYDMARDFKQASVWDLRNYGFELRLAFEDDRRNVAMFRSEGVPCVYFHSGYYD